MPKVIGHTPPWLSQPSPGARIFSDPESQPPASPSKKTDIQRTASLRSSGPRRTIAHRGTEVFTVVGNRIRWADLARVKDDWEQQSHKRSQDQSPNKQYRTLKNPVYYEITDIAVSPSGHFLAIATEYTVHIALLPASSRLHDGDQSDIRVKTHQLGPTTHVIGEAPLATVLWHPFAASTSTADCVVTVTTDAAVRLWEVNQMDNWSFERPTLPIDLRKLADGTSADQDFTPAGLGENRGFSADDADMEVAAASWGGMAHDNEDPWAAMTLWIVMTNGDLYALCPLLPTKWRPGRETVHALTTSAVAQITLDTADETERRAADQQYQWARELDDEDLASADSNDSSIRFRPHQPSAIPRLQGPFEMPFFDSEISDLLVIPANLDKEELYSGEDDYDLVPTPKGLPFTILCLSTTNHQLHVLVELNGISGQWLPRKSKHQLSATNLPSADFILIDTTSYASKTQIDDSWSKFTTDPSTLNHFFITSQAAIHSISLDEWVSRISFEVSEVAEDVDGGLLGRLKLACQGSIAAKQQLISVQADVGSAQQSFCTAVLVESVDLGMILLTSTPERAIAAQLDQSSLRTSKLIANDTIFSSSVQSPLRSSQALMNVLQEDSRPLFDPPPVRAPYAPSPVFTQNPASRVDRLRSQLPPQRRAILTQTPVRLSPACLEIMTAAHRNFSHQTGDVEKAAAELFRRCERLKEEMADQVRQMAEMAERLNTLRQGNDDDQEERAETHTKSTDPLGERIEAAKTRQSELFRRYERVRRKAGQVGHAKQDLSIKERAWIAETDSLATQIGTADADEEPPVETLKTRLKASKMISEELVAEGKSVKEAEQESKEVSATPEGKLRSRLGSGGMSRFQREKIKEVMEMVSREAAVIEAVQGRLDRLGIKA